VTPGEVLARLAEQRDAIERETLPPNISTLFDEAVGRYAGRKLWIPLDGGATLTYREFAAQVVRCAAP
jgi:hypothetical protein